MPLKIALPQWAAGEKCGINLMLEEKMTDFRRVIALLSFSALSAFAGGFVAADASSPGLYHPPTKGGAKPVNVSGCPACKSNCVAGPNQYIVHFYQDDTSDKYCIEFDGMDLPHCCDTEVQGERIFQWDDKDNAFVLVGYCSRPYCPGARPTDLPCNHSRRILFNWD